MVIAAFQINRGDVDSNGEIDVLDVLAVVNSILGLQELGPLERAIVLHTNAPDLASGFAHELQRVHPDWNRLIEQAGVTVASHAGPGAVGVACVTAS